MISTIRWLLSGMAAAFFGYDHGIPSALGVVFTFFVFNIAFEEIIKAIKDKKS